jgi:hypothetical protein
MHTSSVQDVVLTTDACLHNLFLPFGNIDLCVGLHPSFKLQPGYGGNSPHPVLHVQRAIAECLVIEQLRLSPQYCGTIVDVGGSVTRHRRYGRSDIWANCPVLTAQDAIRNQKYVGCDRWCNHLVQDCSCHRGLHHPLMFVHSLYYFSRDDLVLLLSKHKHAYAVVHEFGSGAAGTIAGDEAFWSRSGNMITMSVRGCAAAYHHPDLGWLREGGSYNTTSGTIVWSQTMDVIGDSYVYEFHYFDHYVKLDFPTTVAMLPNVGVLTDKPNQSYVLINGNKVPTLLLTLLCLKSIIIGVDKMDLPYLISHALQTIRQNPQWRLDECVLDKVVVDVCVLALTNARNHHATASYRLTIERIRQLIITFVFPILAALSYLCLMPVAVCSRFAHCEPVIRATLCLNKFRRRENGTNIKIRDDFKRDQLRPAFNYGIAVKYYRPSMHADTQGNELLAINNRALFEVDNPPDDEMWDLFDQWFGIWQPQIIPYSHIEARGFEHWNRRFPKNRREDHIRALTNIRVSGTTKHNIDNWCRRRSFIKRELLLGDLENADPRLIQGVSSEANVLLAPWLLAFSEMLKKQWHVKSPYCFASGLDANDIGSWMLGRDKELLYENDFSRFDRTVSSRALDLERRIYEGCGLCGPALQVFLRQYKTIGVGAHNISYDINATRKSGDPNTTIGNSIINLLVSVFAATIATGHSIKDDPSKIVNLLVGGDDSIVQPYSPLDAERFEFVLIQLGFKPKLVCTRFPDVSFFSARFLPTNNGYILTPKLGRVLAKCGHSVQYQHNVNGWLQGVSRGNMAIFNHVSFMKKLFLNIIDQTKGALPVVVNNDYSLRVSKTSEMTVETYVFLSLVYDISPSEVSELDVYLSNVLKNQVLSNNIITKIMEKDIGAYISVE